MKMKSFFTTTPANQICISGTHVLGFDLNLGWEITQVVFEDSKPANQIDGIVVVVQKKKRTIDLRVDPDHVSIEKGKETEVVGP